MPKENVSTSTLDIKGEPVSLIAKLRDNIAHLIKSNKENPTDLFRVEVEGTKITVFNDGQIPLKGVVFGISLWTDGKPRYEDRHEFGFDGGIMPGENVTVDFKLHCSKGEEVHINEKIRADFEKSDTDS